MAVHIGRDGTIIRDNRSGPAAGSSSQVPAGNVSAQSSLGFYIITICISALLSWLIAAYITTKVFHNVGPYLVFFAGIVGCLWYNNRNRHGYYIMRDIGNYIKSVVSAVVGSISVGLVLIILSFIIQIIFVIIIIVIAFSIFGSR